MPVRSRMWGLWYLWLRCWWAGKLHHISCVKLSAVAEEMLISLQWLWLLSLGPCFQTYPISMSHLCLSWKPRRRWPLLRTDLFPHLPQRNRSSQQWGEEPGEPFLTLEVGSGVRALSVPKEHPPPKYLCKVFCLLHCESKTKFSVTRCWYETLLQVMMPHFTALESC